jgi:hypothetical protein
MKKIFTTLVAVIAIIQFSYGQYWSGGPTGPVYYNGGNVGIGTTNPQRNLDLSNAGQLAFGDDVVTNSTNGIYWHNGNHYGIYRTSGSWSSNTYQQLRLQFDTGIQLAPGPDVNTGYDKSYVEIVTGKGLMVSSGNVGIGTTSPVGQLSFNNQIPNTSNSNNPINYVATSGVTGQSVINSYYVINSDGAGTYPRYLDIASVGAPDGTNGGGNIRFLTNPITTSSPAIERMRVNSNGYVGIGTTTPDAKLAVNGTIHTKEVKVDMTGWNDFVFDKNYLLPTLLSVKTYIDQNHHLPEMPAEAEVIKNGVNLGEMVKLQTKKIEELTLYLIEKDKQVAKQNKLLAEQQKINQSLQQQINQLAKKLKD